MTNPPAPPRDLLLLRRARADRRRARIAAGLRRQADAGEITTRSRSATASRRRARQRASGSRRRCTTFRPYRSSILRHPTKNPRLVDPETIELFSPAYGQRDVAAIESDLTLQHRGEPQGERITVQRARCSTPGAGPIANQLVEIWQANAAGRYIHQRDQHPAPLDPNFTGAGRTVTDDDGEYYFTTIKPGAYPWKNHVNAWRPAHIHFSVFGTGVHAAHRHADVLPGRSAVRARPDLQHDPEAGGSRPAHRRLRPRPHAFRSSRWATGSTSSSTARMPRGSSRRVTTDMTDSVRRARRPTSRPPVRPSGRSSRSASSYPKMHEVVFPHSPGAIVLGGTVYDGAGAPDPRCGDRDLEADADGIVSRERGAFRRDDHTFTGFGRSSRPTRATTSSGRATPARSTARRRSSR